MALLNVSDPAPDFAVSNQDGDTVSLAGLRGRNVILWWYPKANTRG